MKLNCFFFLQWKKVQRSKTITHNTHILFQNSFQVGLQVVYIIQSLREIFFQLKLKFKNPQFPYRKNVIKDEKEDEFSQY